MNIETTIIDAALLAEQYISLRDKRDALRREYESKEAVIDSEMDLVRSRLLALCNDTNASSIKTANGTIIRSTTTKYWTNDWDALNKVILTFEAPYLLEKRIHQSAMRDFLEMHPDVRPAGLNIDSKYTITVRKPSTKI